MDFYEIFKVFIFPGAVVALLACILIIKNAAGWVIVFTDAFATVAASIIMLNLYGLGFLLNLFGIEITIPLYRIYELLGFLLSFFNIGLISLILTGVFLGAIYVAGLVFARPPSV